MSYTTALKPVSEALYSLFVTDSTLFALVPGGIFTDLPEDVRFECLWIETIDAQQFGGFGTKPGLGSLPEIEVRLHAFTAVGSWAACQVVLARAIALVVADNALTVDGYRVCGTCPFYDETQPLSDQVLNGVKVKELVALLRLYVEES